MQLFCCLVLLDLLLSLSQCCLTLCDLMDYSPLSMGFSRKEYWSGKNTISSSRGSSGPMDGTCVSCIAGIYFTC